MKDKLLLHKEQKLWNKICLIFLFIAESFDIIFYILIFFLFIQFLFHPAFIESQYKISFIRIYWIFQKLKNQRNIESFWPVTNHSPKWSIINNTIILTYLTELDLKLNCLWILNKLFKVQTVHPAFINIFVLNGIIVISSKDLLHKLVQVWNFA